MNTPEKWAWSSLVWRRVQNASGGFNQESRHCLGLVMASSQYEAEGKAMACAKKIYQPEDGWKDHNVTVCLVSLPAADPEQTTLRVR